MATETSVRVLDDASYRIPKVYYAADELKPALAKAGFIEASVTTTPRFFVLGSAKTPD